MGLLQKYLLKRRLQYAESMAGLDEKAALAKTYIAHGKYLGAKSAREAAEMAAGRALTEEEWVRSESPGKKIGEGCGNNLRAFRTCLGGRFNIAGLYARTNLDTFSWRDHWSVSISRLSARKQSNV